MPPAPVPTAVRRPLCALALAGLLAGCGTPAPPPQLYQLPLPAPGTTAAPASPAAAPGPAWEVSRDVALPAYLDRETMVVARGASAIDLLEGHRWAEPLRDAVPRLLQHDLAALLGPGRVWPAPAPRQLTAVRRLQVEIQALHAEPERGAVVLRARWSLGDPSAATVPVTASADLRAPLQSAGPADIADAHRQVLWLLAQRIAASGR